MNIRIWWCESMKQWRYTVVNDSRPILKQESGQCENLKEVFEVIENWVAKQLCL